MLCFDQKRHIKGEKQIAPVDFLEHLGKSDVSENSKVYVVDIFEMNFMKGTAILLKVDETYNILKSASRSLLVER